MINLNNDMYPLILSEIERSSSCVYLIKSDLNYSLLDFFNSTSNINTTSNCYYYDYIRSKNIEPYNPIFSIIKNNVKTESELNLILNEVNVYPIHKELFVNYIFNNKAFRHEDILPFDFIYEKSRLFSAFSDILNYLGRSKNLLIFLENLNYATISTIELVNWLCKNIPNANFKILSTINSYTYYNNNFQNEFDDFIDLLQSKELILETTKDIISTNEVNIPINYSIDNYIEIADNFYNFLALNEALYYYKKEHDLQMQQIENTDIKRYCTLLCKIGSVYSLLQEYDNAYEYFNSLLNYSYDINDKYIKLIALQKLSMLNILRDKYSLAETLAKQSYKLALKLRDDEFLLQAYTLIFWINEKAKYRTTMDKYNFEYDFIKLSYKYNKLNMLAYFLTHSFNAIKYASEDDNKIAYYEKGHSLAQKLDNQNCILSAHLKTALVYAVKGYYKISIKYYEEVEKLLIQMKDYFRLAQTYNGIGYYYFTNEQYSNANIYYDRSLQNLRHNLNFDEICMTFINKGLNALLACNYISAEGSFNIFLSLVNVLRLDRLRLSTLSRIYGIIGLNNFYLGNFYRAYSFLYKMDTNKNLNSNRLTEDDDDEFFLFYLLRGLLLKYENNFLDAIDYFEKANYYMSKIEGSLKCVYPRFIYEYCLLLEITGDLQTAYKLKKNGINFCIDNNYIFHLQLLEGKNPKPLTFENNFSDYGWVVDAAKQQISIDDLNSKVDEINFINIYQENLSLMDDLKKAIKTSITHIQNKFSLDYSIMLSHNENFDTLLYTYNTNLTTSESIKILVEETNLLLSPFVWENSSKKNKLSTLLCTLTNNEIHSIIYIPILKDNKLQFSYICATKVDNDILNNEITLSLENLRIIRIAINQLCETIQRIMGQEKLIKASYSDVLTGLCNRQGFYNKIYSLLSCYPKPSSIYLFYIDLDNFKYYNDNFGHKIGDKVLIWFGNLLNNVILKDDIAIRYGGDEFLLLLTDCNSDRAICIANDLYEHLRKSNGFISKISNLLDCGVDIPTEKLLSCSIGIVNVPTDININMVDIMDKADKAMYQAKSKGKHCFVIG